MFRLIKAHIGCIGKTLWAHAVKHAEVDNLSGAALSFGDLVHWNMKGVASGFGVNVETGVEIVDKCLVMAKRGGEAKLELGIIGSDKNFVFVGDEALADAFAVFAANWNVLEVRIKAGEATGCGDILGKSSMNALTVVGERWKRRNVGAEQFADFTVAFELGYNWVKVAKFV